MAAVLCAITLAAYANSFGMGLALDAPLIISKDSRIRAATADNLGLILHQDYWWPSYVSGLYRPVTTVSFLLNYAILGNGESATGYHWVNFLLHLGNVWLVYALSLRLLKRTWPALFATALWAAHPIGTESVTNVMGRERLAAAVLTAVIALFACRTFVRNYDWKYDLTLTAADVRVVPHSFKMHEILANALFIQDPRRNIGTVIEEAERAWDVLRLLPPELIFRQPPSNLGAYYRAKGDLVGGVGTAEGRSWYQKSLAVLLKGREADRVAEKVYDEAMRAHGKPLTGRLGFPTLYLNLGLTYARLGRNVEALEAYRQGRSVDPSLMDFYDAIADVYRAGGNPEGAAVTLDEKTQVGGNSLATMSALRDLYERIPGGSCAIVEEGGASKLNLACPRLRDDLCLAWADLTQAFLEPRKTGEARSLKRKATERYGCPAAPFQAVLPDGPVF